MLSFKERALRIASFLKKESLQDFLDTLSVAFIGSLLATFLLILLLFLSIEISFLRKGSFDFSPNSIHIALLLFSQFLGSSLAYLIFKSRSKISLPFKTSFLLFELFFVSLFIVTLYIIGLIIGFLGVALGLTLTFLLIIGAPYLTFRGIKNYIDIFVSNKLLSFVLNFFFLLLLLILLPYCSLFLLLSVADTSGGLACSDVVILGTLYFIIILVFLTAFSFALGELFFKYLKNKNIFKSILNNWKA